VIIAADIGGTKTNVALLESPKESSAAAHASVLIRRSKYQSSKYPGLTAILGEFLAAHDIAPRSVSRVCAGIAGPVVEGHVQTPNLPWSVDAAELKRSLGVGAVTLINDLEATAERAATLTDADVFVLNRGRRPSGPLTNGAVVAAGTGLGMALLHPIDGAWWPVASEGGHVDLAPRNELEVELLRFLLKRHRRVSIERVVSGPGLVALYEFFAQRADHTPNAEVLAELRAVGADAPRVVAEAALGGRCRVASSALDLFVAQYGAVAGNLALMAVSTGGMFVGGGIAPKILARLEGGAFMDSFMNKGRLSPLLENMPVQVILDADAALMGAARRAVRLELGLVREL
jgi:glucokinase